ncbi:MAG: hypothetical protein JNG88_17090, partial [Phycisphaerales bacterium]|nr:hypothetical protein [Phycisphaerales bacterium]
VYPSTAVRYGVMRWIGEFNYRAGFVFACGAKVVVQTDRGIELGEQVSLTCGGCSKSVNRDQMKRYVNNSGPEFFKFSNGRILREATPQDIDEHEHLNAHNREDIDRCALMAAQMELPIKVVTVEHLLGGERIVFYFRSEDRIDFRDLVRELAAHYRTRIEMRQVGARDEARAIADYEICGRECCCKSFLKKLRPVTMRMAKLQKSTLDPTKVSGRCGRLRCCLRYEHESYESMNARLPRLGARVDTEFGAATVVDRQILTQLLLVRTDDEREMTIPVEEIKGLLPGAALPSRESASDEPANERGPQRGRGPRRPPSRPNPADENRSDAKEDGEVQ